MGDAVVEARIESLADKKPTKIYGGHASEEHLSAFYEIPVASCISSSQPPEK